MEKRKALVLLAYTVAFYGVWTAFELFGKDVIDNAVANASIAQLIKSGVIKNLVWTLPAAVLIARFRSYVHVPLGEMFSAKVHALRYAPLFIGFTVWILAGAILQNGRLEVASSFGVRQGIVVLFVGLTEELVFRGWLLNATVGENRRWIPVVLNALLFLAIHFPRWIYEGVFFQRFADLGFLSVLGLSVIFSLTFIKSKSILVPIALHMYWDLLTLLFLG